MGKIRLLILSIILILVTIGLSIFIGHNTTEKTIKEIRENCDVPFSLALPEEDFYTTEEYIEIPGFGCYSLENEDITYTFSGYPDCLDKDHLTKYTLKSKRYALFGLRVGCSIKELDAVMAKNGFTIETGEEHRYVKNGVIIEVCNLDGIILEFRVGLKITNKKKVVF